MRNNSGFSQIIIIFVVVIVLLSVSFAGYKVYKSDNNDQTTTPAVQTSPNSNELQNGIDVKALEEDVKATDLDAELNSSELDANLNELQ
jgi:predicted negative regulator of RcsB-dependent stress response